MALLEQERARFAARITELDQERDRLRASHERLRQELELFKHRLFVAKAERIDTRQLELEYAQKLRELDQLEGRWASQRSRLSRRTTLPRATESPSASARAIAAPVGAICARYRWKRSASKSPIRISKRWSLKAR